MNKDKSQAMNKKLFIANILLLLTMILSLIWSNYYVDPYALFSSSPEHLNRKESAEFVQPEFWTMSNFRNDDRNQILLGDSRMGQCKVSDINLQYETNYYNFSMPGSSLEEMLSVFWFATETRKLKSVVIGVTFSHFNKLTRHNRVPTAQRLIDSKFKYLVSAITTKTTARVLWRWINNQTGVIYRPPPMTRQQFWTFQIQDRGKKSFEGYTFDAKLFSKFKELMKFCQDNEIELKVVIFPEHQEYTARIADFGVEDQYQVFRHSITNAVPKKQLIDFSNRMENKDANYFKDPIHFSELYRPFIYEKIFGNVKQME